MFYSDSILTKKGPLANIWLAAHWDKKLTKAQIVQTNINESVQGILNGDLPNMALRLSGQLLLGVSKIYDRKAKYLFEDCSDAAVKIKSTFKSGAQVDLPAEQTKANVASITLTTALNMDDLMMPELELNLDEILKEANAANAPRANVVKNDLKGALKVTPAEETGHVGFGPIQDLAEIPGELGDMEIEAGRRASDSLHRPSGDLEALSIEAGRRESTRLSEVLDPMQFSPLRTPQKSDGANVFGSAPDMNAPMMDDDYGYDLNPDAMDGVEMPTLSPVADRVAVIPSEQGTPRPRRVRKGRLTLDETTEITSAAQQSQLRNRNDILLEENGMAVAETSEFVKTKSFLDLSLLASDLNDTFSGLFKTVQSVTKPAAKKEKPAKQVDEEFMAPMMDDDYGFMPADIEPMQPVADENQVPDMDTNELALSGLQSPSKSLTLSDSQTTASSATASAMSRSTLETLEIWKGRFAQAKGKALDLETDLMAAISDDGQRITRRTAAAAFFETLVLRSKNLVQVTQTESFAPISVKAKPALATAVLTE